MGIKMVNKKPLEMTIPTRVILPYPTKMYIKIDKLYKMAISQLLATTKKFQNIW